MPKAQLTHPTCIIAFLSLLLSPFQYLWLEVKVPIEFTVWLYGGPLIELLTFIHALALSPYLAVSLHPTPPFFLPPFSRVIFLLFEEQR